DVGREYAQSELQAAANFFNAEYSSRSLLEVKRELLRRMEQDSASMHELMRTAVTMAGRLLNEEEVGTEDVLVSGEDNLINVPDFFELEKLRRLFDTFHMKQVLLDLLQKSIHSSGVNIFIGEESGYKMLKGCSVITAPYEIDSERVGVLGVIGPTRMAYDEVISVVDVTARLLGGALSTANH
ncbi:MAG: HrcA family transcriptional regulator, partial [Pseudomonadota bacterium]|nr:HrcA family transcriptional regulator [Pseudomonadota bacterium]